MTSTIVVGYEGSPTAESGEILGDRASDLHAIEGPPARTLAKLAADTRGG